MERPTHEEQFGSIRVKIQNPAPRKALRTLAYASSVLGARLIDILTDNTVTLDKTTDDTMKAIVYQVPDLLLSPVDKFQLGTNIVSAMARLSPDDAVGLVDMLLLGQASIAVEYNDEVEAWAWVQLSDDNDGRTHLDNLIPDGFTLLKIARWAFSCYFRPISAATATDESSSTESSERPTTSPSE